MIYFRKASAPWVFIIAQHGVADDIEKWVSPFVEKLPRPVVIMTIPAKHFPPKVRARCWQQANGDLILLSMRPSKNDVLHEIQHSIDTQMSEKRVIKVTRLNCKRSRAARNKSLSPSVVLAVGTWDLLHVCHKRFLEKAKRLGDKLMVGVLTDEVARAQKRQPVIPLEQRLEMVKALKIVDDVVVVGEYDRAETLRRLEGVDVLVYGGGPGALFRGADYMKSVGKGAVRIPYGKEQSTTSIIKRVLELYGGD